MIKKYTTYIHRMILVLVIGGWDSISPRHWNAIYTWKREVYTAYWVIIYATYHLLQKPQKSVHTFDFSWLVDDEILNKGPIKRSTQKLGRITLEVVATIKKMVVPFG